jgi:hypothetical protein
MGSPSSLVLIRLVQTSGSRNILFRRGMRLSLIFSRMSSFLSLLSHHFSLPTLSSPRKCVAQERSDRAKAAGRTAGSGKGDTHAAAQGRGATAPVQQAAAQRCGAATPTQQAVANAQQEAVQGRQLACSRQQAALQRRQAAVLCQNLPYAFLVLRMPCMQLLQGSNV